ncbi:transcription factor TFIIIB component B'' homolog [Hypanus sabinus]|uniref:transcription factor TFIIIB component B'' homolog n=1 Tax=Hypanus sabinus TaxID=79690 RepID=UPI0028C3FC7E|nr:transcription factor TFIIIB component B'' homolog [Hypanus sabinus]
MLRRSRLSIRPNVKPGGRVPSQTGKGDDKTCTSDQQLISEGKPSNEKEAVETPAVIGPLPVTPLPSASVEHGDRDDLDEQQENVPLNKNEKADKTGESGAPGKPSMAPLQRRKRFSTMPNLVKPRSTSLSMQQSINLTEKSPQQQSLLTPVTNVVSFPDSSVPSQITTTEKTLAKSPEKRKPSSGPNIKLPEKKTPIPQIPQFSPVKNPLHKESVVGVSSTRLPVTRKVLSSPLKERITPSGTPTKGIVPSPSVSPARPKNAKIPSDLERLQKARKLREMLKEELKREKKAHRESVPVWEASNPPERTKMTMRDFIYYLPDTNPMLSSFEEERRPSPPIVNKEPEVGSNNAANIEEEDEESDDAVLGPRVKVAEDGSIIIDEESLTVEVLRMKTSNIVEENDPIFERGSQTTYSSFRKSTHTKPWSDKETDMFFLAISMVGTDFSMIGQLFPNRSRIEIKNKFKREEKLNSWRIDKAFKEKKPLDLDVFGELLTRVLEGEAKKKKERNGRDKGQALRKSATKRNRKSKKLEETESDLDDPDPVEMSDQELAEADSSTAAEGTGASCGLEGTQNKETVQKTPIKRKRKRKKMDAADAVAKDITKDMSEEEGGIQQPKRRVQQREKGAQNDSGSGRKDGVQKPVGEAEDESDTMANVEALSDQESSKSKQPSRAKRKIKPSEEDKLLSDCENDTPSTTTPPVPRGDSNQRQFARPQKFKPNLKLVGRNKADRKTTLKPATSYDSMVESRANAAQSRPDSAQSEADTMEPRAEATQSSADAMKSGVDAAQSEPDSTQSTAEATQSSADAMKSGVDAAQSEPDSTQSTAEATQSSADAMKSGVDAAQSEPDSAQSTAEATQSSADAMKSGVDAAQSEPDSAQSTAEATQSSADAMKSGVDAAQSKPDSAQTGANMMKSRDDTTQSTADVMESEIDDALSRAYDTQSEADDNHFRADMMESTNVMEPGAIAIHSGADVMESGIIVAQSANLMESRGVTNQSGDKVVESGGIAIQSNANVLESGDNVESSGGIATQSNANVLESGDNVESSGGIATQSSANMMESGDDVVESGAVSNQSEADMVEESLLLDHDAYPGGRTEIISEQSEKDVSNILKSEKKGADKAEEVSSCEVQDSVTAPRFVEKPGRSVRSRLQKPKPNLGRAVIRKDASMQERKTAARQENNIATQDIMELSPGLAVNKESEAHRQNANVVDTVSTQPGAVQNQSKGTNEAKLAASLSESQFLDAACSDTVESKSKNVPHSITERPRKTGNFNKEQQLEKTFQHDEQNEQEELTLAAFQENIMSKPTRSGRQPKPTTFYNPSANQPPPAPPFSSEGDSEGKVRSRLVRSQKTKSKVSKVLGKKEAQIKTAGSRSQGTTKKPLVTLRAFQEEEDDEESDAEHEEDIYPINPEEVNKAPAFVPISLRSPEPVQAQVEETMEELEIALNVSDKNCTREAEHSLLELRDKREASQSCTFIPEEDYRPATADQIELFVEVFEVPNEGPNQDGESSCAELGSAFTGVICVDQKSLQEESGLAGEVPSLQIIVCSAESVGDKPDRPEPQNVLAERELKAELDSQELLLPKGESTKAGSSSLVTEEPAGAHNNVARRRGRFLKPKPNLSNSSSRSRTKKPCPTTESEEMQSFIEPTGEALTKEKHGIKAETNCDDLMPVHLLTTDSSEENVSVNQMTADESSEMSITNQQEKCVSDEQVRRSQYLDHATKLLSERLKLLVSDEQSKCVGEDDEMNREEHQDSGSKHLRERLNLLISDEQGRCVGEAGGVNRTEHMENGSQHLTEKLSLLVTDKKDQYVTVSNTEPVDSNIHNCGKELSICDEQEEGVAGEEQVNMTAYLGERMSSAHNQPDARFESQDVEQGISSDTYCAQSAVAFCHIANPTLSIEATETTAQDLSSSYSPKIDVQECQSVVHQEALNISEGNLENFMAVESPKGETIILTLVEIPASSLTGYSESSASYMPNSENSLGFTTSYPPLLTEHTETTARSDLSVEVPAIPSMSESVAVSNGSSEISVEAPTIPSMSESMTVLDGSSEISVEAPSIPSMSESVAVSDGSSEISVEAPTIPSMSESMTVLDGSSEISVEAPSIPSMSESVAVSDGSSEVSVEATTIPSMSESETVLQSNPQQCSSNMPGLNSGQMDRKRQAASLIDDKDSTEKRPEMMSSQEVLREKIPQSEEVLQSNSAAFTSPEDWPASSASNTLNNYDLAHMSIPSESAGSFTSTPLDVVNPTRTERSTLTSVPVSEETRKASQRRRGKVTVKPNFSTARAAPTPETGLSAINAGNNHPLKLPKTPRNAPSLLDKEQAQTEAAGNSSVQEFGADDYFHGETEAQNAACCSSPENLSAVPDADAMTGQSETSAQDTAPISSTTLTRQGRKPRGFLSFISKKPAEGETELKPKKMKFPKARVILPQFAGKRPSTPTEDAEDVKPSGSPPAKKKLREKAAGSRPNAKSVPTKVMCNSSLQSWQSESYAEEACCAMEQDTERVPPTSVAEYFFSDIFTEVDEQD